uniref:Uncharacterized protein n=1 Tax=candidate division CPR3 bacterium TaxID=2268181 RepID=A0A7V3JAX4_UNCC3
MIVVSKRFQVRKEDLQKVGKNALIFFAPLAVIYLSFVATEIEKDGFTWEDFRPNLVVLGAMILYVINVLLDFFRKWASETRYTSYGKENK